MEKSANVPDYLCRLDADGILDLDEGALRSEIDRQLLRILQDITDRPCGRDLKTVARKLTIQLKLEPQVEINKSTHEAQLSAIVIEPTVRTSVPDTRGGLTQVKLLRGEPFYNRDIPESFDQQPLPFDAE